MSESPAKVAPSASVLRGELFDGRIATLTLNRPERKNALGPEEWQLIGTYLDKIGQDRRVRGLLIRGAGGAFSSGGDLRSMPERLEWPLDKRTEQLRRDAQVIRRIHDLEQPVIAAIEGPCMGAGLALALACDLRIAATSARFGAVFHRIGLTADFGLSWLLPRAVGASRASELLLTAAVLDAVRAVEIGLVQRAVPNEKFESEMKALCQIFAEGPPLAQAQSKRALRSALTSDLESAIAAEAHAQARLGKTADAREGVAAFLEKRAPLFKGE